MLGRYTMYRGRRPPSDPLPEGIRQDTRKHTRHCLRPDEAMVRRYLAAPSAGKWREFEAQYLAFLEKRFREDPHPFAELARLASETDVYLGCNCPTKKNPDVHHCHTVLALRFMKRKFRRLEVVFP